MALFCVILKPCRASRAAPACTSLSNSTKAMSCRPGTRRTSLKPGNLGGGKSRPKRPPRHSSNIWHQQNDRIQRCSASHNVQHRPHTKRLPGHNTGKTPTINTIERKALTAKPQCGLNSGTSSSPKAQSQSCFSLPGPQTPPYPGLTDISVTRKASALVHSAVPHSRSTGSTVSLVSLANF